MGYQLIVVVETNNTNDSDWIYIKETINRFYSYDCAHFKLCRVYMNGKGHYRDKEKEVVSKIKQYNSAAKNNRSKVIYCFDCDEYDNRKEDEVFLNNAKLFCREKGYGFVWFCKDIERVYLRKKIPDNNKGIEAARFRAKKKINEVDASVLSADTDKYSANRSNLLTVLDTLSPFLKRK